MSGLLLNSGALTRALVNEKARRVRLANEAARALAVRMEASAKEEKPWRDQTGRARDSIRGTAEETGGTIRIALTGNAPYSAALELGMGGRYAVLGPTVRAFTPGFLRAMAGDASL